MGFFSKLFNRTRPPDPSHSWPSFYAQGMVPPSILLTPQEQLSLSAVFACIRVIAEAVASSPWSVFQMEGRKRVELPDDPAWWLLNVRPNPDTTAQSLREALMVQALVTGNGYLEIVRDTAGRVTELRVLPSDRVRVQRDPDGTLYYVFTQHDGGQVRLEGGDVFHLRALASADGLMGDSVVGRAAKAIAAAHAAEQFSLAYFANNLQTGAIIKVGRQLKPEEEANLLASYDATRASARKAFKPIIAPPGVEIVQSEVRARDSQVVEVRQFSVEEVIRFFGVPPHLVGVSIASQGYGRNLAELGLTFTRHTLRGWSMRLDQEARVKLFPQRKPWKFTELDLTWLTEGDALANAQANEVKFRNGVISKNEWRDSLNLNAIPDGDQYDGKAAESPESPSEPTDGTGQGETPSADTGPSDDTEGDDMGVAEMAIRTLVQERLRRHANRLRAREADLAKAHTNGVLADKLSLARQELRDRALRELHVTDDLLLALAGHAVELDGIYQAAIRAAETGDVRAITDALVVQVIGGQS